MKNILFVNAWNPLAAGVVILGAPGLRDGASSA